MNTVIPCNGDELELIIKSLEETVTSLKEGNSYAAERKLRQFPKEGPGNDQLKEQVDIAKKEIENKVGLSEQEKKELSTAEQLLEKLKNLLPKKASATAETPG